MSAHKFNSVVKGYNKAHQPTPESEETPMGESMESVAQQAQEQANGTEEHCPSCGQPRQKMDFADNEGMTIEVKMPKKRK